MELQKQVDISIMRIIATIAVIFLHTCNTLSNNSDVFSISRPEHIVFYTGNFLMNWAVPVFFMITGILLLNKDKIISSKDCVIKYTKRILLALAVFGIPFSWIEIYMTSHKINFAMFPQGLLNVIEGESWSHLWYLYTLIGIYLTLPIWKSLVNNSSRQLLKYIISVLFLFNFVFPMLESIFNITIAFQLPVVTNSLFYLLVGRYLRDEMPDFLKKRKITLTLLFIIVAAIILISIFTYPHGSKFLGYNSPLIAALSVVVFSLLSGLKLSEKKTAQIWKLDRLCFGVYLIHPIFINFVYKFLKITPLSFGNYFAVMVFVFSSFFVIISFIASWLMSFIKPLKKYIL